MGNVTTKLNVTMQRTDMNESAFTAQDLLLMENRSDEKPNKRLLTHSLPLPIIPNFSVVLGAPNTSGHHVLGLFPKSLVLLTTICAFVLHRFITTIFF